MGREKENRCAPHAAPLLLRTKAKYVVLGLTRPFFFATALDSPSQGPAHEKRSPEIGLVAAPHQRLGLVREVVEGVFVCPALYTAGL